MVQDCKRNRSIHYYILPIKWSDYIGIVLSSLIEGFLFHRPRFMVLPLWDNRVRNSKVSGPNCAGDGTLNDLSKRYRNFYFCQRLLSRIHNDG